MYNDIAYLIKKRKTENVDVYGDPIYEEVETIVYVNVESVKRSEFYTASQAGFNPQIVFVIADYYDYDNQPLIRYNSVVYKIIRTYQIGNSLQIVCEHYDSYD